MTRLREWWRLWWDETLIIIGVSTVLFLFIWGVWYLFQTMPFPLEEGIVVEHKYTAQYEETHDGGTTCYSYDKYGACTFKTDNPDIHHTHCVGGCYEIRIDGCSNDRRGEQHCRKEWFTVSQFTYDGCADGQLWKRDEPRCALR